MTSPRIAVVSTKGLDDLSARSFTAKVKGKIFRGFIVRKGNHIYAYQNLCRHLPVTLDLNDGHFFTAEGDKLQCHMHGAIYEIESGLCTAGPCQGASLFRLKAHGEEDRLLIEIPEEFYEG